MDGQIEKRAAEGLGVEEGGLCSAELEAGERLCRSGLVREARSLHPVAAVAHYAVLKDRWWCPQDV